jgi:hypothetical protein
MLQFNTAFLLKATAITALCCLPMALNKQSGFVWTAFLLPTSLACLAATQVAKRGEFEFRFKGLSNSVVEINAAGGPQSQWLTRSRVVLAGACFSIVIGFPMLHIVDPEPIGFWLPIVVLYSVGAVMLLGYSARRTVLTQERQFVTDYLLFGRLCWRRRRWQVCEGDFLAVFRSGQSQEAGTTEPLSWHALFICRSRRRPMFVFGIYTRHHRVVPELEIAALHVARLVEIPYEGCRNSIGFWWSG